MECYVVVAEYRPHDQSYDVLANFQGPFCTHPVMAKALRVPGTKMRLRIPPDSGGSFGIKLSVFPYIVLAAIAAKIAGRPVKWVEDRAEHLLAASSGPNRITKIEAAVTREGRILGLRLDQLEDYGAYLRAPMPGPLYRMHGAVTGAYDIPNVDVVNRIVLTNKMPASLIRGFGGPQLYLAIERLVHRIAVESGLDHLDVIRRNLVPTAKFPYRAAAGALYDSGDFERAVETTVGEGRLADLKRRREEARAKGKLLRHRLCRRGRARHVEHGLPLDAPDRRCPRARRPKERRGVDGDAQHRSARRGVDDGRRDRAGPGARKPCCRKSSPIGSGLSWPTSRSHWRWIRRRTPGRSRPAPIPAGFRRGRRLPRTSLRRACATSSPASRQSSSMSLPDDIEFADGKIRSHSNPDNALPFGRVAGTAHWSPVMLPDGMAPGLSEIGVWSPAELEPPIARRPHQHIAHLRLRVRHVRCRDRSGDFPVRIDRYVSMHDAGTLLNPLIADGQVHGAFVQGIAAALYEEFVYDESGSFLSGSFADYLVPTVAEIPEARNPAPGDAVAADAARRQGHGGRQLHEHARLHRQRGCRRSRGEGRRFAG